MSEGQRQVPASRVRGFTPAVALAIAATLGFSAGIPAAGIERDPSAGSGDLASGTAIAPADGPREPAPLEAGGITAREPAGAVGGLAITDLIRLMDEGIGPSVIVKKIRSTGVAFHAGVDALLALKRGGASDAILEAVIEADDRPAAPGNVSPAGGPAVAPLRSYVEDEDLRIYEVRDPAGRRFLVLTNIDENGRRLGGEVASPGQVNLVSALEPQPEGPVSAREPAADRLEQERAYLSQVVDLVRAIDREEPRPEPPPQQPSCTGLGCPVPFYGYNTVAVGGAVGGYKFPDRLWFLGYTPTSNPVVPSFAPRPPARPSSTRR